MSDLKNLPKAINNPLIVFENPSKEYPNRIGLLINLTNGKRNFLAVIQVNDSKDGVDLNNVVSIHPRNFNNFVNWINDKSLLYADKENTSKWLSSLLVETENQSHLDNAQTTRLIEAKIQNNIEVAKEKIKNFENPKIESGADFHIGAKARLTYEEQIRKRNPNISEEHLQESLDFLHSLEDNKENTKAIKIAVKWLQNDTIRLPFAMDNVRKAIAVFNNYQDDNNRSIPTELNTSQGNVLVSIKLGERNEIEFNVITSVFGKSKNKVIDWIGKDYLTYVDKEKALSFLFYQSPPIGVTATKDKPFEVSEYLRTPSLIDGSINSTETISPAKLQKEIEVAKEKIKNFENAKINEVFNKALENVSDATTLHLGNPNFILKSVGIPDKPIILRGSKILSKANTRI